MGKIISDEKFEPLSEQIQECLKILNGLIGYYEKGMLKWKLAAVN
jgi:hypothetical protein